MLQPVFSFAVYSSVPCYWLLRLCFYEHDNLVNEICRRMIMLITVILGRAWEQGTEMLT
jgi:hypothetical protein